MVELEVAEPGEEQTAGYGGAYVVGLMADQMAEVR